MKQDMALAQSALVRLLEANPVTQSLYVRVHGKNLILGREEAIGEAGEVERYDRVRLTRLQSNAYGLSVRRHNGRWERTPFSGTLEEMVEAVQTFMQHLVAPYWRA